MYISPTLKSNIAHICVKIQVPSLCLNFFFINFDFYMLQTCRVFVGMKIRFPLKSVVSMLNIAQSYYAFSR